MLGRVIRKAREAAGLTQEELAAQAGIHRTYVSLLERDLKSPTVAVLARIAGAIGVSAASLLAEVERARPPRPRTTVRR